MLESGGAYVSRDEPEGFGSLASRAIRVLEDIAFELRTGRMMRMRIESDTNVALGPDAHAFLNELSATCQEYYSKRGASWE